MLLKPISFLRSASTNSPSTVAVTFAIDAINTQAWSGDIPLGITELVLPSVWVDSLSANDGSTRAYSDAALTNEIPLDVLYANPHWYRRTSTVENYGFLIRPAAKYYAHLNQVVHCYQDAYEMHVERWDVATERWLTPVYVGSASAELRIGDTHGNPALIYDPVDSTWHMFGGGHNTEWTQWTSTDLVTWTLSTPIPGTDEASYPNMHLLGNDIAMFMRCNDGVGDNVIGTTYMYLKSDGWINPTSVTDLHTNGPNIGVPADEERTYHTSVLDDGNGNLHFTLTYNTLGSGLYPYVLHAVFVPTITNGEVTNFRWRDIAGNWLGAEGEKLTWAMVTATPSLTQLVGDTGTGSAVESDFLLSVGGAVSHWYDADLDDNGYPHMLISVTADATRSTATLWYIRWNGTNWDATPAYFAEGAAPLKIATKAIYAATANDVTVIGVENSTLDNSVLVRFHYNGTTWTRETIDALPAPTPDYRINGTSWRQPFAVIGAAEAGVPLQVLVQQCNNTQAGAGNEDGGGMPVVGLSFDGSIVRSNKFLAFASVPVPASGDATIYLHRDGTRTISAVDSTYGRNAVWSDYSQMIVPAGDLFYSNGIVYTDPQFTDRTGNLEPFRLIGTLYSTLLTDGKNAQTAKTTKIINGVESLRLVAKDDSNLLYQDEPDQFVGDNPAKDSSVQNFAVSGLGDLAGDFVILMVGDGEMRFAESDEDKDDVYQIIAVNEETNLISGFVRNGANTSTNVPLPAGPIYGIAWIGNTVDTQQIAANGVLGSPAAANFPPQNVLNAKRMNATFRASSLAYSTGSFLAFGIRNNQSADDWRNGRSEIETYAWSKLGDPSFCSAVTQ